MKQMGYHEGYRYAHDEPNGYAAGQTYFPEGVARPGWYQPTDRGVERRLGERLTWLRRSEEHTSELQSLMRISYAVFCLKKKNTKMTQTIQPTVQNNNANLTIRQNTCQNTRTATTVRLQQCIT